MNKMDPELKNFYIDIKNTIKDENTSYINMHPEIRQLLNDYMSSLLLHKPEDVFSFTKEFFSFFNKNVEDKLILPLLVVGPSGVGKVALP